MVNSVRFGTTASQFSSFQDLVSKPQTYRQNPVASTGIYETKKKGKAKKVILGTLTTAAVVAGAMLGAKHWSGWITNKISKIGNETIKKYAQNVANFMAKGGNKLVEWGGKAKTGATSLWEGAKKKLNGLRQNAQQAAQQAPQAQPTV